MNKPYTPEQLQGKFICCSVLLSGKRPVLDCVRYSSGERSGLPVLYDSIIQAKEDQFFDDQIDEIIPASEYFERMASQQNQVTKPYSNKPLPKK
jgi:hypothetical protein